MNSLDLLWNDYRYFPYERMLAKRETEMLFGAGAVEQDGGLRLQHATGDVNRARRLTYFKGVRTAHAIIVPDQTKLEASGNGNGSSWDYEQHPVPSLHRQVTRYSAHGLHEYRGKFNPQVVRAVGNLLGLEEGQWVLDPFCGSGTTLLEAAHIGWNAIGTDLNPLGVLIANAKLTAISTPTADLLRESYALGERISRSQNGADWRDHLPEPDYLEKWFPERVLQQLRILLRAISGVRSSALQELFRVILSDICREVSLQDPGDLRIRRRKDPAADYPAIEMFLKSLELKIKSISRAREHICIDKNIQQQAIIADARNNAPLLGALLIKNGRKTFDAAITSPPYATAMPYLDTQRLSLALLGLTSSRDLRDCETQLIGNREIRDKERLFYESHLQSNAARLPHRVITFCKDILVLANHEGHGFRRRNVPALVYKYLADMNEMFTSIAKIVRSGGRYALLVGRNTTTLRGQRIQIDTPELLAEIAAERGWCLEEMLPLQTYHRFDVHRSNSIREEVLIILRNAATHLY